MIFGTRRFCRHLYMPNEIADDRDFICSGVRKLNAGKFIFNQYHQLELIEPVEAEILTKARFICNLLGINTQMLGNKRAYSVGIKINLWRDWCAHRFPRFFPARQRVGPSALERLH